MDIIHLLWWWLITTIISTGTVPVKKQTKATILSSRSSFDRYQGQIQPKYQPQAAASSSHNSNSERSPSQSESEPQQVSLNPGINDNMKKSEISPAKKTEQREVSSSDLINLELSPSNQNEPLQVDSIDIFDLQSSSGKKSEAQATSGQEISEITDLEESPSKISEPRQVALSEVANLEDSPAKQVGVIGGGGSAMSPNIGESIAPSDERPSRTEVSQEAPAPVAQPPPSPPPPTLIPPGDNKNKTVNGTEEGTNCTTTPATVQDIDADMKQGAKGKSFTDTVTHRDLKDVKTKLENLGGDNQDYGCQGNRGPLRPMYERSKYFVDMVNRYTYEEGKTMCLKHELIFAEIDSLSDFKSIQLFFDRQFTADSFNGSVDRFFIGLNDLENEGVYRRADGTNITFQAYFTNQPDDRNESEDCTAVGKEEYAQPMGMMDVSCMVKYHLLCMFPPEETCINDTRESNLFSTWMKHVGIHSLMDMTERTYSVANFQLPWEQAFDYCLNKSMKMFDMDHMVTTNFFRTLYQYENKMIAENVPVIQWWTAGRFKKSHMTAEVYWENDESVHSENMDEHQRNKQNFTFSGIFRWNNLKGADPTARLGKRKDLCLSFGFQLKPEDTPYVRNTNCGLPCYFVCAKDHEPKYESAEVADEMK